MEDGKVGWMPIHQRRKCRSLSAAAQNNQETSDDEVARLVKYLYLTRY